jgi:hypothetical protein
MAGMERRAVLLISDAPQLVLAMRRVTQQGVDESGADKADQFALLFGFPGHEGKGFAKQQMTGHDIEPHELLLGALGAGARDVKLRCHDDRFPDVSEGLLSLCSLVAMARKKVQCER